MNNNLFELILPGREERILLKKETDNFIKKFRDLKTIKFVIGGSYAKGTWLSGNQEVLSELGSLVFANNATAPGEYPLTTTTSFTHDEMITGW